MLPHNKIIKTTVKEFLEPKNLFQVGSSRSWLDDNGYFFVIVDFSSNSYSKIENICCHLTSQKSAQQMVVDMINRRRKNFCEKSSYKKMSKEPYLI